VVTMVVRLALPKGSLEKETFKLFEQAGYSVHGQTRSYRPTVDDRDIELKILRPQEIPMSVAYGLHDLGITGKDWIEETHADVEVLQDLEYGNVKLVLAVPKTWENINSLSDLLTEFLSKGRDVRISTEYLNITRKYVKANKIYREYFGDKNPFVVTPWWRDGDNPGVTVYLSFGATEAKPPEDADAIIDLTETGVTLEQNNLKLIDVILESSAVLIANRESLKDPEKHDKIYDILALLRGVVDGRKKIHIFVNVSRENLNKLLSELPALKNPTVSPLSNGEWYAVNTVIDRKVFLKILPTLRRLAQGLVVHEPQQILPLEEISREEER